MAARILNSSTRLVSLVRACPNRVIRTPLNRRKGVPISYAASSRRNSGAKATAKLRDLGKFRLAALFYKVHHLLVRAKGPIRGAPVRTARVLDGY